MGWWPKYCSKSQVLTPRYKKNANWFSRWKIIRHLVPKLLYGVETPSLHNRAWLQSGVSVCTLCRAKQREVPLLPEEKASAPDLSLLWHQASHSPPAKSPSFFLAAIQESTAPFVGWKVKKALLGYTEIYTNTAWRMGQAALREKNARLFKIVSITRWRY